MKNTYQGTMRFGKIFTRVIKENANMNERGFYLWTVNRNKKWKEVEKKLNRSDILLLKEYERNGFCSLKYRNK